MEFLPSSVRKCDLAWNYNGFSACCSKITQKKISETDTQVQTTLLKLSILNNTPTNWRLLHPNFQMIHKVKNKI